MTPNSNRITYKDIWGMQKEIHDALDGLRDAGDERERRMVTKVDKLEDKIDERLKAQDAKIEAQWNWIRGSYGLGFIGTIIGSIFGPQK